MRTSFEITADDCYFEADDVDPSAPGYGAHLPFHAILQRCGQAWRAFLAGADVTDTGVIVPNVNADFLAEVHPGTLDVDVVLTSIGTTSFTVRCDVSQDGVEAARVQVVLVCFDYADRTPLAVTDEQRARLHATAG